VNPSDTEICFGPFRLDLRAEALWRGGAPIHLRTKTWQVLRHLVAHPGALVTKEQLLDAVWGDVVVSEETLTKSISELRRAFGDDPRQPRVIETVHGRGFRLLAQIPPPLDARASRPPTGADALGPPVPRFEATAPVFGRDAELVALDRLFDAARAGDPRTVFVTGDPGIGKTSLLQSFLARRGRGDAPFWLLAGQCLEQYGSGEPHRPLLDAFEALLRAGDADALTALARRTAPTWLAQIPWAAGDAGAGAGAPTGGRPTEQRMPRELAAFLEGLGGAAPVVLAVEDLHWSDAATMDVLALLAHRTGGHLPLLVVGTYRPSEAVARDAPVRRLHRDLRLRRACAEIALEYLTEDAVRALLVDRLGPIAQEQMLARLLHEQTDGHPLFAGALIDHLLEREWLAPSRDGWRLVVANDVVKGAVPTDARQMIERIAESLTASEQETLRAASLVGLEFDARAVAAAMQCATAEVEATCDALAHANRLVRPLGPAQWPDRTLATRYAFRHALHRRVFDDPVPTAARRELHQRIGERIEAGFEPDPGPVCSALAEHFTASGDGVRAGRHLELAGARALGRYAYREALSYLDRALRHTSVAPAPAQTELRLRRRRAVALAALHGYSAEPVAANLARARELCQEVQDPASSLEVLYALGLLHFTRADRDETWRIANELRDLTAGAAPIPQMQGLHALGSAAVWKGEHGIASDAFTQLFALHRENAEFSAPSAGSGVSPIVSASSNYAYHLWLVGKPEEAKAKSTEAVASARSLDDPFSLAGALVHAAILALIARADATAEILSAEAHALSGEHDLELWLGASSIARACATFSTARDPERALARARTAIAEWEATSSRIFLATAHGLLASALLDAKRPADGLAAAERGIELAETTLDRMYEAELWRVKGELLLLDRDDGAAARACLDRAAEIATAQGATALLRRAAESRARLDARAGHSDSP
jgi:DNA-binding winged helix-turn-helix (wHTH) protein